jgi:hypothetical protein
MSTNRKRQSRKSPASLDAWVRWQLNEFNFIDMPVSFHTSEYSPWDEKTAVEFFKNNKGLIEKKAAELGKGEALKMWCEFHEKYLKDNKDTNADKQD